MSLVLSRDEQESIVIFIGDGQQIRLTVDTASGGRAKLVFDAPANVIIWREELLSQSVEDRG